MLKFIKQKPRLNMKKIQCVEILGEKSIENTKNLKKTKFTLNRKHRIKDAKTCIKYDYRVYKKQYFNVEKTQLMTN